MERFRRAVNGKRLFTAEFKREQATRTHRVLGLQDLA